MLTELLETLKLHIFDYHCRNVLFGCSHDNGYARLLEGYIGDSEVKERLTLLEGTPFEKEVQVLPFHKHRFDGIFRSSKIVVGPPDLLGGAPPRNDSRVSGLNPASGMFTPRTMTPALAPVSDVRSPPPFPRVPDMKSPPPMSNVPNMSRNPSTPAASNTPNVRSPASLPPFNPVPLRSAHERQMSTASVASSGSDRAGGWSVVAAKSKNQPLTDLCRPPPEPVDTIKRNKHGQRIDEVLEYDRAEVQRLKKLKPCNQHYLNPNGCCHYNAGKADKCPHAHNFTFSPTDLKNLRVVAHETPCKKGHECDDRLCIYGHRCPFPVANEGSMRGIGCLNGNDCRFPRSMHGMDTVAVRTKTIR